MSPYPEHESVEHVSHRSTRLFSKYDKWWLFFAVTLLTFLQAPSTEFMWGALEYIQGSIALISGGDTYQAAALNFSGAWTPVIFAPAAFIGRFFEAIGMADGLAVAVLLQGSISVGLFSVLVLPSIARKWFPDSASTRVTCAILGYVFFRNFAAYPIMDLVTITLLLFAVAFVMRENVGLLFVVGLALGICMNLRSSYTLTVILILISVAICHHRRWFVIHLGVFVALLPQFWINWSVNRRLSPFPIDLTKILGADAASGSYIIRYDTVAYRPWAFGGLNFCDPAMMKVTSTKMPTNSVDLFFLYASHPIESARFLIQKLGAVLLWPVTAPYYESISIVNIINGYLVLFVTTFGIGFMLFKIAKKRESDLRTVSVMIVIFGYFVVLVLNHSETRYAISLVALGIIGFAGAIDSYYSERKKEALGIGKGLAVTLLGVFFILLVSGYLGLRNVGIC